MAGLPTGVSILATRVGEILHAVTVGSLMSISLDPPLVAVSLKNGSRMLGLLGEGSTWTASVLRESAREIAIQCGGGNILPGPSALDGIPHSLAPVTGLPVILNSRSFFECQTNELFSVGDHTIVIGAVLSVADYPDASDPALFFCERGFGGAVVSS